MLWRAHMTIKYHYNRIIVLRIIMGGGGGRI